MDSHDLPSAITDCDSLRQHYGPISGLAEKKVLDFLDPHARRFIELSPFHVLATAGGDGTADATINFIEDHGARSTFFRQRDF